jgi:signal transduction histidine kinase
MLYEFIAANTTEIIVRTRAKVVARKAPVPTEDELRNGVPLFLRQLIDRLRLATLDSHVMQESAALHGGELLAMGFSVSQVIHGYGDICQVITQLADETDTLITAAEFHTFNRCLDDAIAHAVSEYMRQRDESVAYEGMERLGTLAHELRNRLSAAMLSFTILQQGTVGIGGSTGSVLGRNLRALRDLVNNSLADMRIDSGISEHHRVSISEIVRDAEVEAAIGADSGGFTLTVSPVAYGIHVHADPQILSAAISNLLQNAFKFSRVHGHVSLRATATGERVTIEIEDECGGLAPGAAEDMFPPFQQPNATRTGLGLGLTISRKGVEAMGGTLRVRDLRGKGCIFSIELPRLPA